MMILTELHQKIRNAEEPNNCALLSDLVDRPFDCEEYSVAKYRVYLEEQFRLLMEALSDDCLPSAWRQLCLDHIHCPLFELWSMVDSDESQQRVMELSTELRVVGQYFATSMSLQENY